MQTLGFRAVAPGPELPVAWTMAYPLIMPARMRAERKRSRRPASRLASDREISDFLFRVCHDLRAPARAIRSHSELLLRDGELNPDLTERLKFIVDGARRLDSLIDALSSYSVALRTEAEWFQPTAMDVLLRTVIARLEKEIVANQAEVTTDALPRVRGNPDRLMELLERLIHNAIVHRGADPPRIHIGAAEEPQGWRFAIADNGPGVDPAYRERIFMPFDHSAGGRGAGAGMGLAICRAIVERHGGTIWVESPGGKGTTFLFTLPSDQG